MDELCLCLSHGKILKNKKKIKKIIIFLIPIRKSANLMKKTPQWAKSQKKQSVSVFF